MRGVTRLVLVAAFVLGSIRVTAHADNNIQYVPMTSSPNPSVAGQMVVFKIEVGDWCQAGGSVLDLYDGANFLSLVYLPNTLLGATTSYYGTTLLSVGTHRMWATSGNHMCLYQQGVAVQIAVSDYFQVVNAPPPPPPPPPANPPPPPPPPPPPVPSPSPSPTLIASPTPAESPPAATAARLQPTSAMQKPALPLSPGGMAMLALVLAAAVILGGSTVRRLRVRRR